MIELEIIQTRALVSVKAARTQVWVCFGVGVRWDLSATTTISGQFRHQKKSAIPENREFKKWKFSFFHQRHALSTSFDIFVVTYRETNFLPKLVDMLLVF